MKTIALLLLAFTGYAQNLSLTSNTTLGENCGQGNQTETFTYQDVNLNGYRLTLRNVNLVVTGNLNGPGEITNCGNPNQVNSTICVQGSIQNNPNLNGLSCTLSIPNFEFSKHYGYNYSLYDIHGKLLNTGITKETTYSELPEKTLLIFKVEGFNALKIIKQ